MKKKSVILVAILTVLATSSIVLGDTTKKNYKVSSDNLFQVVTRIVQQNYVVKLIDKDSKTITFETTGKLYEFACTAAVRKISEKEAELTFTLNRTSASMQVGGIGGTKKKFFELVDKELSKSKDLTSSSSKLPKLDSAAHS